MLLDAGHMDMPRALAGLSEKGYAFVPGALNEEASAGLIAVLERLSYRGADEWVNGVRQGFGQRVLSPEEAAEAPNTQPLAALAREMADTVMAAAAECGHTSLAADRSRGQAGVGEAGGYRPTEIAVQRYAQPEDGITPHRDGLRFRKLVCVFSLGAEVEFSITTGRSGEPLEARPMRSGDLALLRGPGFGAGPARRPYHAVTGPAHGVRYSVTLRMRHGTE
ncbi:MAG: alpha-ketoglutarate-dependent dioxygenase AlkB [Chloroflexota bacterium]